MRHPAGTEPMQVDSAKPHLGQQRKEKGKKDKEKKRHKKDKKGKKDKRCATLS